MIHSINNQNLQFLFEASFDTTRTEKNTTHFMTFLNIFSCNSSDTRFIFRTKGRKYQRWNTAVPV